MQRETSAWDAPSRLVWVVLVVAACFSESKIDDPSSATTDPSPCEPGLATCPCLDGGVCNPGLECVAAAQVCAPEGCTPGALGCICVGSSCLDQLQCDSGFCVEPPSATTGGATGSTTTLGPTSSSDGAMSSEVDGSAGATTDGACSPISCGTCNDCDACLACAVQGGPCEDERAACTGDCETLVGCVEQCDPGPSQCGMTCCCQSTTAWEAYNALVSCLWDQCTSCARPLCATLEC